MGNIYDWAKEEVRLACEREHFNKNPDEWDYGCACYESALKAFKSLCEDEHSGMSISLTKNILNRLINCKPLTPIENNLSDWNYSYMLDSGEAVFQNSRLSSLFKHVNKDQDIHFSDMDRIICVDINDRTVHYHSGLIEKIYTEMFPISFPYYPFTDPIKVYVEEFLVDKAKIDFDVIGIFYAEDCEGNRTFINRFFTSCQSPVPWLEITEAEYIDLKSRKVAP